MTPASGVKVPELVVVSLERYDSRRQRVTPAYERLDYDIVKRLA